MKTVYGLQLALCGAQLILSIKGKQYGHAMYWLGAIILTLGVMMMK